MTDPIADMLTRIRNAQAVRKEAVIVPISRLKRDVAKVLLQEGYIHDIQEVVEQGFPALRLVLKYFDKKPAIRSLDKISTPGCRVYAKADQLPVVVNNLGIAIISTSKGVMTNRKAKKMGVGGEVICHIS